MTSFSSIETATRDAPRPTAGVMAGYAAEVPQLGVGQSGKDGLLRASYARHHGVTRQVSAYARPPMYANGVLYLDDQRPGMAFAYLMSGSEALIQGDRLSVEMHVGEGAELHVTNTAATKVNGMRYDYAVQHTALTLEAGAFVEWLPEPIIPHAGARLYQHTALDVHPEATLIFGDVLSAGRLARGERFEFEIIASQLAARRGQTTLFDDNFVLRPGRQRLRGAGLFGDFDVQGTFYVLTRQADPAALADSLHEAAQREGVLAGATCLPKAAGVMVRALGARTATVQAALRDAWALTRRELLGADLPDTRKY